MRALTWQGTSKVSVETVPDPKIQEPTDAIVRMTSTAICGSDLHLYDVLGMYIDKGDVLGHEPMGVDDLTTHRLPLEDAPHAYEIFKKKEDGCIKVVLKPGA
jgi:threonine dehydrogenase-like Zn-dependent dehydrogenase